MTYMLLLNCALKLVEEIILYYDAWSKKHQITNLLSLLYGYCNSSVKCLAVLQCCIYVPLLEVLDIATTSNVVICHYMHLLR